MSSVASLGPAWACPDLVVAADVVYHRNLFDPLLSTLASLGRATGLVHAATYCSTLLHT